MILQENWVWHRVRIMIISNAQSPTKLFNNPHRLAVSIPVVPHCGLVLGMSHSTGYAVFLTLFKGGIKPMLKKYRFREGILT